MNGANPKIQFQEVLAYGDAEGDTLWMSEPVTAGNGDFVKTFIDEGTYIYSTGYVDDEFSVHLNGIITVTRATERAQELTILLADSFSDRQWGEVNEIWEHTATHVAGGGRKRRESTCNFAKTNQENPLENPPSNHYLIYSFADTPIVDKFEINPDSVTNETINSPDMEITLTTRGGITAQGDCASKIELSAAFRRGPEIRPQYFFEKSDGTPKIDGNYKLDNEGTMDIRETYEFNLNLEGLGNAYYNNYRGDQRFKIKPNGKITNRVSMSSLGNVDISISGLGFVSKSANTMVFLKPSNSNYANLRPYKCEVSSMTYESIECHLDRVYGVVNDDSSEIWDWEVLLELTPNGDDLTHEVEWHSIGAVIQSSAESTPTVTSADPMTFDADSPTKVTFSGNNFGDQNPTVKIGEEELVNCAVLSETAIECDIPSLSAGEYEVSAKSHQGEFKFANIGKFKAGLSVTSVAPLTGGRFGGQLLTLSGYGLSEDTVVTVVKDGINLCSPCIITVIDGTTVHIKTPAASTDGLARIIISHEYIDAKSFSFDFTYSSGSLGSFSLGSGTLVNLDGEEVIELTKSGLSCSDIEIELTLAKDPCSAGAHDCHSAATCTSNSGGIGYTCECTDEFTWGKYLGDGFNCARYRNTDGITAENAKEACERLSGISFIYDVVKFENEAEFQSWAASDGLLRKTGVGIMSNEGDWVYIKDNSSVEWTPSPISGSVSDGNCLMWDKDLSTFLYSDCNVDHRIVCESQETKTCSSTWNGYLYRGDLNDPQDGETCMDWADIAQNYMDELSLDVTVDHGLVGNKCRNPSRDTEGPWCFTNLEPKDGLEKLSKSACLVPRCEDLSARQCRIESAQPGHRDIGFTVSNKCRPFKLNPRRSS